MRKRQIRYLNLRRPPKNLKHKPKDKRDQKAGKKFIFSMVFSLAVRATFGFPPSGKCFLQKFDGLYTYTGTPSNPTKLSAVMNCDPAQNSFQFMSWIKLTADVAQGQQRYFFRYSTTINLYFKGLASNNHEILLIKTNESPTQLLNIPVGKSGKWMFLWLQVTQSQASLAVRSTMSWDMEENRVFGFTFGNFSNFLKTSFFQVKFD